MQLKIATDYAIRIVAYLAETKEVVPSIELHEKLGIPQSFVFKLAKKLCKEGIINTYVGAQGGFILALPAEEISLFQIISIMENTTKINRCLEEDEFCSRHATLYCPVRKFYQKLQDDIETSLKNMTIADLMKCHAENTKK